MQGRNWPKCWEEEGETNAAMPCATQMCLGKPSKSSNDSFSSAQVFTQLHILSEALDSTIVGWAKRFKKTCTEMLFSFLAGVPLNNLADGPKLPPAIYIHFVFSLK